MIRYAMPLKPSLATLYTSVQCESLHEVRGLKASNFLHTLVVSSLKTLEYEISLKTLTVANAQICPLFSSVQVS